MDKLAIYKLEKSNDNPEIVYGKYTPYVSTGFVEYGVNPIKDDFIKSLKKSIIRKSNINNAKVEGDELIFDLSFLKDDGVTIRVPYNKGNKTVNIMVYLSKSYKRNQFTYFDLDIWEEDTVADVHLIARTEINDSYKKWDDCVGYLHGIYRTEKNSCYQVTVSLTSGIISSKKIKIV